jgi:hypothetical protein
MVYVDIEVIEAQLEQMKERMEPGLEADGWLGVVARMQHDVLPALTLWRTQEMNRLDADPNVISEALITLFASTMFSEVCAVLGPDVGDKHYSSFNRMLQALATEGGSFLAGTHEGAVMRWTEATEEGRA